MSIVQRKRSRNVLVGVVLVLATTLALVASAQDGDDEVEEEELEKFTISDYAVVENARQFVLAENGVLFVGPFRDAGGSIYAVQPEIDEDTEERQASVIDTGFLSPTGIALHAGDLYVADVNRIVRYDEILETYNDKPVYEVVVDNLPADAWHGRKYIAFGPDGYL